MTSTGVVESSSPMRDRLMGPGIHPQPHGTTARLTAKVSAIGKTTASELGSLQGNSSGGSQRA